MRDTLSAPYLEGTKIAVYFFAVLIQITDLLTIITDQGIPMKERLKKGLILNELKQQGYGKHETV